MTPRYTETDFNDCKSRGLLPLECEICHEIFHRPKKDIQWSLKSPERKYLQCCSIKCNNINLNKQIESECFLCHTKIKRKKSDLKKVKYTFCSKSCAAKYNNTHKTKGTRRSKLEVWLETQLTQKYPNLLIEYNKTNAINAELDIYIPSLKLAFELNGIFHYEPIYGPKKLNSTQTNDNRKFHACLENFIGLCVIDTTSMKYFKEEKANTFLKIINDIIDNCQLLL